MQDAIHSMNTLFQQLGMESSDDAIETFLEQHAPVPEDVQLHEADFWSESQAKTLKQLKDEDADWAIWVDELDTRLRKH